MEYRPRQKAKFASIEAGKAIEKHAKDLRAFVGPALEGQAATRPISFLWNGSKRNLPLRGAANSRDRRYRPSTSTARCGGDSAGSSGRSKRGTPSESSEWRKPLKRDGKDDALPMDGQVC